MKEKLTNENVRARLHEYTNAEPITYSSVGKLIGLDQGQCRYLISRFARGQDLNDSTLETLSEYLTKRGY